MTATDKAKYAVQNAKGRVKEGVGHLIGNDRLAAEGKDDQAAAHVKQAAERAKDAVASGVDAVKDKAGAAVGKVTGDEHRTADGPTGPDTAPNGAAPKKENPAG